MTEQPPADAILAEGEPCCADTCNGPLDWWVRWQTDARLLRYSRLAGAGPDAQSREVLADVAGACLSQIRYRSAGLVPDRATPLPWCDCPGGPSGS